MVSVDWHCLTSDRGIFERLQPFSEETARNIDGEVRRIVDEAYKQCRDLLEEKHKEVGIVTEELQSKEMLTTDAMVRLRGPRPFDDQGEFQKYFGGGLAPLGGGITKAPSPNGHAASLAYTAAYTTSAFVD
jgi:AFG3 family protein